MTPLPNPFLPPVASPAPATAAAPDCAPLFYSSPVDFDFEIAELLRAEGHNVGGDHEP